MDWHNESFSEKNRDKIKKNSVIAYCDHCGFAIYRSDDALMINGTEDRIHSDCWEEYAIEHMFDFAKKIPEDEWFDREF